MTVLPAFSTDIALARVSHPQCLSAPRPQPRTRKGTSSGTGAGVSAPGASQASVQARPRHWQAAGKAGLDLSVASVLLVLLLPLMCVIALLIGLESPGPVLFSQVRVGRGNRLFRILKFRTMYHHLADAEASLQTGRHDARVTRVGRVLRRLSIDELPQLLNVLRGDMSLVGPRPHAPGTSVDGLRVAEAVDGYHARHSVKPGITGWAQVNGSRGNLQTRDQLVQRLSYDLDYIARCSLLFDVRILWLTALRGFVGRNAF